MVAAGISDRKLRNKSILLQASLFLHRLEREALVIIFKPSLEGTRKSRLLFSLLSLLIIIIIIVAIIITIVTVLLFLLFCRYCRCRCRYRCCYSTLPFTTVCY